MSHIGWKRRATLLLIVGWCMAPKCYETGYLFPLSDDDTEQQQGLSDAGVEEALTYINEYRFALTASDGLDLLVVVDNSSSMGEAQQILSDYMASLITNLTMPSEDIWRWGFPAVENVRVAVVSTDMGLQANGEADLSPTTVPTCENPTGDDGRFLSMPPNLSTIHINDSIIPCDVGGPQCPPGFTCGTIDNTLKQTCQAEALGEIFCDSASEAVLASTPDKQTAGLAVQSACLVQQGTKGCGIEQPLEAMVRGLESHTEFLKDSHVLGILIISDEDDCSINDPKLFDTPEWQSLDSLNTACQVNETNRSYLFEPSRYYDKLVSFKNGREDTVVFAAVVGVPKIDACRGNGTNLMDRDCLLEPEMQPQVDWVEDTEGFGYYGIVPACTRTETLYDDIEPHDPEIRTITSAAPGRRFVEVAERLGRNGMVDSICNPNYTEAAFRMGQTIATKIDPLCLPSGLPWAQIDDSCMLCGQVTSSCDLFLEMPIESGSTCPDALYKNLKEDSIAYYKAGMHDGPGRGGALVHFCPLPKLPTAVECEYANRSVVIDADMGWYYCLVDSGCAHRIVLTDPIRELTKNRYLTLKCSTSY